MTLEQDPGIDPVDGPRQPPWRAARGRARPRWALLVLSALILVVSACTAAPAAPTSTLAPPTPLASADAAGFGAAACTANAEMFVAWGNPDTGVASTAWKAFESAAQTKDAAQIDAAAAVVLRHLEAARVANDHGATWAPGAAASAELSIVLAGLVKYVVTVRDARGEPGVVAKAVKDRDAAGSHLQPYWQMLLEMMKAKAIPITQVPC
jgi:hypothetical protein